MIQFSVPGTYVVVMLLMVVMVEVVQLSNIRMSYSKRTKKFLGHVLDN